MINCTFGLFQSLSGLARLALLSAMISATPFLWAARGQDDALFDRLASAKNVLEAKAIIQAEHLTPEEIAAASKFVQGVKKPACGLPEAILFWRAPGGNNGQESAEVAQYYLIYSKRPLESTDILASINLVDLLMQVRPGDSDISNFLLQEFFNARFASYDENNPEKRINEILADLWMESMDSHFFEGAFWVLRRGLQMGVPTVNYLDVARHRFGQLCNSFLTLKPDQLDVLITFGKERLFHTNLIDDIFPVEYQRNQIILTLLTGYPTLFNTLKRHGFETTQDQDEQAKKLTDLLFIDKRFFETTIEPPKSEEGKEESKAEHKEPPTMGPESGKEDSKSSSSTPSSLNVPLPLNLKHLARYRSDSITQAQYRADYESSVRFTLNRFQQLPAPGSRSLSKEALMMEMGNIIDVLALRRKVMALAGTNGILDGSFGELRQYVDKINMVAYEPYFRMLPTGTTRENVLKLPDGGSLLLTTMHGGESWTFANHYVAPSDPLSRGTNKTFPTIYRLAAEAFLIPVKERDPLRLKLAELHWVFANAMPYNRGSAAIVEMFIDAMWRYHGFEVPRKVPGVNLDCEALSRTEEDFARHYPVFTPPS